MNEWKAFKLEHKETGKVSYAYGAKNYIASSRYNKLKPAIAAARSMNRHEYNRDTKEIGRAHV